MLRGFLISVTAPAQRRAGRVAGVSWGGCWTGKHKLRKKKNHSYINTLPVIYPQPCWSCRRWRGLVQISSSSASRPSWTCLLVSVHSHSHRRWFIIVSGGRCYFHCCCLSSLLYIYHLIALLLVAKCLKLCGSLWEWRWKVECGAVSDIRLRA